MTVINQSAKREGDEWFTSSLTHFHFVQIQRPDLPDSPWFEKKFILPVDLVLVEQKIREGVTAFLSSLSS